MDEALCQRGRAGRRLRNRQRQGRLLAAQGAFGPPPQADILLPNADPIPFNTRQPVQNSAPRQGRQQFNNNNNLPVNQLRAGRQFTIAGDDGSIQGRFPPLCIVSQNHPSHIHPFHCTIFPDLLRKYRSPMYRSIAANQDRIRRPHRFERCHPIRPQSWSKRRARMVDDEGDANLVLRPHSTLPSRLLKVKSISVFFF